MTPEQKMEAAIQQTLQSISQNATLQQGALKSGYLYTAYISTLLAETGVNLGLNFHSQNTSRGAFQFPTKPREVYDGARPILSSPIGKELGNCMRAAAPKAFQGLTTNSTS